MNSAGSPATRRGTLAEIRPDLRVVAGLTPRSRRTPQSPVATVGLLVVALMNLVFACLPGEWPVLAAIALTALASALLLAAGPFHRAAWLTCAVMCAPALIGITQWFSAATADWAATELRMLRALAAALFCLSVGQVRDGRERDRLMDGLTVAGGLLAALALWQLSTGQSLAWWPFPNRNHFAAFCELLGPVAAWRAAQSPRWQLAPAAALALAGMLTGSRAGLLLIAGQTVWLAWWATRHAVPKRPVRWIMAGALALPLLAALLGGEALSERWKSQPLLYRDQIWLASWDLVAQRPWQGHGLGSFSAVYPSVMRFDTGDVVHRAHNDWLEWMVEGGVPAAVPMFILLMATLFYLRSRPWALGVPAVLAHSLVDYPLDCFCLLLLFGLIATLTLMEPLRARSQSRTRKKPGEKPFTESESFSRGTLH